MTRKYVKIYNLCFHAVRGEVIFSIECILGNFGAESSDLVLLCLRGFNNKTDSFGAKPGVIVGAMHRRRKRGRGGG